MGLQQLFCPSCRMTKMGRVDEESNKPLSTSVCSDCGSFLKKVSEMSSKMNKTVTVEEQGVVSQPPVTSPNNQIQEEPDDEEEDEEEPTGERLLVPGSSFTFEQVRELMGLMEKQLLAAKPNNVPNIVINLDEKLVNRGEVVSTIPQISLQEQQNLPPRKTVKTVERDSNGLIVRVIESEV